MEDTQMPSANAPQAPQQEANPNPPASSSEPVTSPTPKKGGGLIKTLVGVFAVAILGFGGWYAYDSGLFDGDSDDTPPSLTIGGAGFQGKSVDTAFGFTQFDGADETDFDDTGMNLAEANNGVTYLAPLKDTDFDSLVNAVKPTADLKLLVVRYDKTKPWAGNVAGEPVLNGCFSVHPVGPYDKTCEVLANELVSETVLKGESIAYISNIAFEYDSNLLADARTLGDTLNLTDAKGWSMHPLAANMDLTNPMITSLWVQKSQNEFEKVNNISALDPTREYKMAWFKIGTPASLGSTTGGGDTPGTSVCGNAITETGEACDDGTANNSDSIADACRTTCVVAACGDGVVDTGEECDGTTGCEADCTVSVNLCENGTLDAGEVCDGAELDGNMCADADSTLPYGTLGCNSTCDAFDTSLCTDTPARICGDNVLDLDQGEICDGTALNSKDCTDYATPSAFSEGDLACLSDCSDYDTALCAVGDATGGASGPTCGDGVMDANEDCDTDEFGTAVCSDYGTFTGGDLSCTTNCTISVSTCTGDSTPAATSNTPLVALTTTNIGLLNPNLAINVGSLAPTNNTFVEKVDYINNLETELGLANDTGLQSYQKGEFYTNKDDGEPVAGSLVSTDHPTHILSAVKVYAGGTQGDLIIDKIMYYSMGDKAVKNGSNEETVFTLEYCLPSNPVGIFKYTPTEFGFDRVLIGYDADHNLILKDSEVATIDNRNRIDAGEWAIFTLEATDMSHCHDEAVISKNSTSVADFSFIYFTEGGTTENKFSKIDMGLYKMNGNTDHRNITWY